MVLRTPFACGVPWSEEEQAEAALRAANLAGEGSSSAATLEAEPQNPNDATESLDDASGRGAGADEQTQEKKKKRKKAKTKRAS